MYRSIERMYRVVMTGEILLCRSMEQRRRLRGSVRHQVGKASAFCARKPVNDPMGSIKQHTRQL